MQGSECRGEPLSINHTVRTSTTVTDWIPSMNDMAQRQLFLRRGVPNLEKKAQPLRESMPWESTPCSKV